VDQYFGGIEHAVLHLFYSRFFTKVLRDLGMVAVGEPFRRYFAHGMVLEGGAVMSKSRGGVGPDEMIARYGADALRTYVLFMGPPEAEADWKEGGIGGIFRLLNRVWRAVLDRRLFLALHQAGHPERIESNAAVALRRKVHQTIRRVTQDIERFHFNTAISAMMELVNAMVEARNNVVHKGLSEPDMPAAYLEACESLSLLLAPFAPHLAEEMWEELGNSGSVHLTAWPDWEPAVAQEAQITVVVQVNGKVRDRWTLPPGMPRVWLEDHAKASPQVKRHLEGRRIKQVVVVLDRLVNVVTE
jgi:leucyl-tRNA synthetase